MTNPSQFIGSCLLVMAGAVCVYGVPYLIWFYAHVVAGIAQ